MMPKTRHPKHVREMLKDPKFYVYCVQHPESALNDMTSLMIYFMEKYEAEQKISSKLGVESRRLNDKLIADGYWRRG